MSQFKELRNPLSEQYLTLKEQIFHYGTVWNHRHDTDPTNPDIKYEHPWYSTVFLGRANDEYKFSVPMSSLPAGCMDL